MPNQTVPLLYCRRAALHELTADLFSPAWRDLPKVNLSETVTGGAPEQGTRVSVAWNDEELRVIFDADDVNPWATLTERDAPLYTEEVMEVFLDPVGDLESYFEIEVNPLNTVLDLVLRRSRSGYIKDIAWRCDGLRTVTRRTERGWAAEMAIPFASLVAEPPRVGSRWRVNFFRIDRPEGRERELSAWSPTRLNTFHVPQRFGVLEFVE
ncbi:carbohydrate-binding family 9-like protein [Verrucomicrobiota bacterium sgz303538]